MSTFAINSAVEIGRLTKDPELRSLSDENSVCKLRLAVDGMGQGGTTGYVDVDVFGPSAESCAEYLTKGRQVGVKGRLQWREWESEGGGRRQAHSIVANSVQFLGGPREQSGESDDEPAAEPVAA
jgi:single-strand DNA-binding protein